MLNAKAKNIMILYKIEGQKNNTCDRFQQADKDIPGN